MKKNKVFAKLLYSLEGKNYYKLILNDNYEKDISISNDDCDAYRCNMNDAVHRRISEELYKLGISDENLDISVL